MGDMDQENPVVRRCSCPPGTVEHARHRAGVLAAERAVREQQRRLLAEAADQKTAPADPAEGGSPGPGGGRDAFVAARAELGAANRARPKPHLSPELGSDQARARQRAAGGVS